MFISLANIQATGAFGKGIINNSLLESFTLHTRVLLDFLYVDDPRKEDDVIAIDFLEYPGEWKSIRPEKSETLASIHKRVGKEVAHLTYARHDVSPESKSWPFLEIAHEVEVIFSMFLELVPADLLGQGWEISKTTKDKKINSA